MGNDRDIFRARLCVPGAVVGERERGDERDYIQIEPNAQGAPIDPGSEIVMLEPRDEPGVFNIKTVYKHKGPAKVATPRYRANHAAIFGKRRATNGASN